MTKLTPRAEYLQHNLRANAWHDFLYYITYHTSFGSSTTISSTTPSTYVHTPNDRWEYLRQIAAGHINIPDCGPIGQAKLRRFLRENDPENQ